MAFNFGGLTAAASNASGGFGAATATASASQPSGGGFSSFGFGAQTAQQQQQQQPGISGANTAATSSAPSPQQPSVIVPSYDELFPARAIWYKIDRLLRASSANDDGSQGAILASQELIHILAQAQQVDSIAQCLLLQLKKHSILDAVPPDNALRQRLAQHPLVLLSFDQDDGSIEHQEAALTPTMLRDVCEIADDLHISEVAAICLFRQAASAEFPFRSNFVRECLTHSTVVAEVSTIPWLAREIYAAQSSLLLRTSLALVQHRLREGDGNRTRNPVSEATDALLQLGWINNLIQLVQDYTSQINRMLAAGNEGRAAPGTTDPHPSVSSSHFWRHEVVLQACFKERQLAAECLFFIAYHVQLIADEVVALIDLVNALTDGCVVMNPYSDVPDPYETLSAETTGASHFYSSAPAPWLLQQQQEQQKEKDKLAWQTELATSAWRTGQPQLLRCSSVLLIAIVSALGDRAVLMDRTEHVPHEFGVVRSRSVRWRVARVAFCL